MMMVLINGVSIYADTDSNISIVTSGEETEINNLVTTVNANCSTDYEKIEYLYNILKSKTYYGKGSSKHNVYSALIKEHANCTGISRAFKLLCNKMGIECEIAVGYVNGSSDKHMWNCIRINGNWKIFDLSREIMNNSDVNEYFAISNDGSYVTTNATWYSGDLLEFESPE